MAALAIALTNSADRSIALLVTNINHILPSNEKADVPRFPGAMEAKSTDSMFL